MLDLSSLLMAWSAPMFIGIVFTFILQVDSSNDLAGQPILAAHHI